MLEASELADAYALNLHLIKAQSDGLTTGESLLQPPFRGNCLNWVLGHLAVNRNRVLLLLGEAPVMDEAAIKRYERGSAPVSGPAEDLLSLEELIGILERSQAGIAAGLQRITAQQLDGAAQQGGRTVAQALFGLYFHETYHTGQTELLRQLAGKNDAVV